MDRAKLKQMVLDLESLVEEIKAEVYSDVDLYKTHTEEDDRKFARNFDLLKMKNWSLTYKQLDQIASLVSEETRTVEIKGGER